LARAHLSLLSRDEAKRIHEASLRVLEEVGVKILSPSVRNMLQEHGAEVDGEIVKIPSSMVEEALKTVSRSMVLAARDPKLDLKLPNEGDHPYAATNGVVGKMYDLDTGEARETRLSDLRDFAVLCDYLDDIDFFWPILFPTDVPSQIQNVRGLATVFENFRKHVQWQALNAKEAKWIARMASIIVGGEEKLKERSAVSIIGCTISPLTFEAGMAEAFVELAKAWIPVMPFPMPLEGMTGPATIAGTLTIANSENLATLVMVQCANPGAPMIYCAECAPIEPYTGKICYEAVETPLLATGVADMARFYGLPCYSLAAGMDVRPRDWDDLLIRAAKMALTQLMHPDITAGLGTLDEAEYVALEQLLLDVEAWRIAKAYLRSFEVSGETIGLEAIKQAGPGGSFLSLKHTLKHFEREVWIQYKPKILRYPFRGSITDEARKRVKEILGTHRPEPLEEEVKKELEKCLEEAEKDLKKGD